MGFAEALHHECVTMKDNFLKAWIAEKSKELTLFQAAVKANVGVTNLRMAIEERMVDLRSRFTYDATGGRPIEPIPQGICEIIAGQEFQQEVLYRTTPTIIGKINSIVHNAEDHRLTNTLKRMELSATAPRSSSETRKNDVDTLAKKVDALTKKFGRKKEVRETLLPFILCSASILTVNFCSLADLCSGFLDATCKEAEEGEEEWWKADHLKQKSPEEAGQSFDLCEGEEKATYSEERRQKGFWEEEWQEVGLACDELDSWFGSTCNVSADSSLKCTSCATHSFLTSFYPLSLIFDLRLHTQIQLCSFLFQVHVLKTHRKINVFDYTTYPQIVSYMPVVLVFSPMTSLMTSILTSPMFPLLFLCILRICMGRRWAWDSSWFIPLPTSPSLLTGYEPSSLKGLVRTLAYHLDYRARALPSLAARTSHSFTTRYSLVDFPSTIVSSS